MQQIAHNHVKIIEKIEGSERTNGGIMNASFKKQGKSKETFWIKHLMTDFSYGLNDTIDNTVGLNDEIVDIKRQKSFCPVFM